MISTILARTTELKAQADRHAESNEACVRISRELDGLLNPLDKADLIDLAKSLKIVRRLTSKAAAIAAIRRKVFEVRDALVLIAY